jgi:hypothetical protein
MSMASGGVERSPARGDSVGARAGAPGMGDSWVMEGIERDVRGMVVDEGRVGVEDPCMCLSGLQEEQS